MYEAVPRACMARRHCGRGWGRHPAQPCGLFLVLTCRGREEEELLNEQDENSEVKGELLYECTGPAADGRALQHLRRGGFHLVSWSHQAKIYL
jgi:hypothetical protein